MSEAGLIAVTGATGFLGSHVCDVLRERGLGVRAAHRATSDLRWLEGKGYQLAPVDLAAPPSLDTFLAGCTGVIHCAGALVADETTYERVNVAGTRELAAAAARAGTVTRLVYISSLAAGGPAGLDAPREESMPDAPLTGYGRSKLRAEQLLAAGDWPFGTVSLRPPSLYGPRDREFRPLLRAARHGFTARVGRRMQGLSMVHGRDAATAAVALLETPTAHGHYYVDDGPGAASPRDPGRRWPCGYDWQELQRTLSVVFARELRQLILPPALLRAVSRLLPAGTRRRSPLFNPDRLADLDTEGWVCAADRLRRDTGWQPAWDLASGLRDTVSFYRRRGWL